MGASQQLTAGLVSQIASGGGVAGLTPLADLRLPSDTVVLPVAAASVFTYDTTQVPQCTICVIFWGKQLTLGSSADDRRAEADGGRGEFAL